VPTRVFCFPTRPKLQIFLLTDAGCSPPARAYTHPASGRTDSPPPPPQIPPAPRTPLN